MDNQEAIEIIKLAQAQIEWDYPMDYAVAFDMAISALQAQDSETRRCATCKHNPPSKKYPCVDCDMRDPADRWDQQELSKNSTELDKKNGELQPTCNQLATDTISRQAIINSFRYDDDGTAWDMDDIVYRLEQLPSAQPDGIPIEWIDKHLEWLDNCDNDFAQLAKVGIRAMVEIWKKDKT